jgi:NAD(P)-dependent dehydrogenase (short-subunit alcohol dehydrogenase family)
MMMNGWTVKDMPEQQGRVVVITGANSGVGYESAVALAHKGAQVIMACRSMERAEPARQALLMRVPGAAVEVMQLDLANLQSVYQFADAFQAQYDKLDILMNNAGIMIPLYGKTKDGFEQQFGTNHLGHFALTGLLLPMLLRTPKSRVVTVSSSAFWMGQMRFDDLQSERRYSRWEAYAQSKLANILFARELQRRLEASGAETLSNVTHPGHAATNLQNHPTNRFEAIALPIMNAISGQPAAKGAIYQLYAATAPEARGGEFYGPRWLTTGKVVPITYTARAQNDADAARLWKISEQLTGVCYDMLGAGATESRTAILDAHRRHSAPQVSAV